ncbi:MAG: toprim domain-containing protein [Deltaproteobacteria bacterium]|jgi:DNA primase|nr:toprim domain-containing protein [Deltaproteobacteria bacterium]
MKYSIPQDIIEEIRRRSNILELMGDLQKLRRVGKGYMACCPFHEEKTPSFSINEEEGLFHCFGCGKKGTVFDYVMETKRLTFIEAVRFLAGRVGITIPENQNPNFNHERQKIEQNKKHKILLGEVLASVVNIYRNYLHLGEFAKAGRDYIESRGINREVLEKFKLGFAPDSWDFITDNVWEKIDKTKIRNKNELIKILAELGLVKIKATENQPQQPNDNKVISIHNSEIENTANLETSVGHYYDAYRNRIIFPILRSDNAPIALGGRIITAEKQAKYINSPESIIYHKRETLYGLSTALAAIKNHEQAILVEGYMDVISLFQSGIQNVVAGCGTSITEEHVRILKRLTGRVLVLFDSDLAGRKAAANCFALFLNSGVEVTAATLPEGEDPDSFAKTNSLAKIEKYLKEKSVSVVDVYLDYLLFKLGGENEIRNSGVLNGRVVEEFVRTILPVQNPVEKEFLIKKASVRLGVSFESILELLKQTEKNKLLRGNFGNTESRLKSTFKEDQGSNFEINENTTLKKNTLTNPEEILSKYWKDILIALLVKPSLAGKLLSLSMQKFSTEQALLELMPPAVSQVIQDFSAGGLHGVANGEQAIFELKKILQAHNLNAELLVGQALFSAKINDLDHEQVIEDIYLRIAEDLNKLQRAEKIRQLMEKDYEEQLKILPELKL